MMNIFTAEEKAGCGVGLRIVSTDESGEVISDLKTIWTGFDRDKANMLSLALVKSAKDVADEFARKDAESRNPTTESEKKVPRVGR